MEGTSRTLMDTGPDMGCTSPTAPLVDMGCGTTRGTSLPPFMHTRQGTDTRGRGGGIDTGLCHIGSDAKSRA